MMASVQETDLHAYADGELPHDRRAEIEAWLASHPDDAARVAAWRTQARALHHAFDPVLNDAVPLAALPAALHGRPPGRRAPGTPAWRLALPVGLCCLAVGASLGWLARGDAGPPPREAAAERFARDALLSHAVYAPEVRHVVEVDAADEAHLVAWLSKRLGAPLRVPDLRAEGFRLIGGRLGVAVGGPSAILMYESEDGARVSLQLRRMAAGTPETGFRLEQAGNAPLGRPAAAARPMAFYWVDRDLGFALAGTLERARLLALAQAVYQQYRSGQD
ncbi:transcriptional regulator [Cupriavidus sp. USMAA2-4]|uniref:anti-sigma factor n=1 Tax=Cupriavidus sp. USMAA2-4 TaxID=876364 RepID=UPI0008A6A428|nr:anti-sigma factor [Cupriavidus sp. USMAA2-4]AOY96163.1 transcriptional regulator [Cupriavidus sp. USMAA2-4]